METTEQKPAEKSIPTAVEIDTLLALYLDADGNVDNAIEVRNMFGQKIEEMIASHGFLPRRATKSKRIQGEELRATLSKGQSVDVDASAVQRFHARLKGWKLSRIFRKLFKREVIFVLNEHAQAYITALAARSPGIAAELQLLFAQTLKIESRSSSLKVEPLKPEKKEAKK